MSKENENTISYETKCGIIIAVFAAIMAITDLFAGKYGDDEIILTNEKAAAYNWYQSKSIKETLLEGEKSLLESLIDAGAIQTRSIQGVGDHITKIEKKLTRYKKDKNEILLGSQQVGKENWSQDIDGQLGHITGAKEIEKQLSVLSSAGDKFDMSSLFFQVCLVFGALSLVLKNEKTQKFFFQSMIGLGALGTGLSIWNLVSILQSLG